MYKTLFRGALVCSLAAGVIGCETKAGTGALVGGAGGAAVGGAIGSMSHARAGEGALIGAAVGAVGGALVGHSMDKADEKKDRERDRSNPRSPQTYAVVTKSDVINWTQRGTSDAIIIDRIERSGTVFRLTAADENDLHDRGVSDSVISTMRNTGRR